MTTLKPLTMWITINCGKFLMIWEYQTTLPASWETCMQDNEKQLETDIKQRTGYKLGKEYIKTAYHHPAYLTYMQRTSWEMPGWMNDSWNQDCLEKYWQSQIWRWFHFNHRKWRGTKEPFGKGERGKWKSWLKTQYSKN